MKKIDQLQKKIAAHQPKIQSVQQEIRKVIVGQDQLINRLLLALLTRGHILLEGVPGLAKTTAILTLAKSVKADFQRIQFTPDLLPSDLVGSRVFDAKKSDFFIKKGPLFANFILADEINRSPAKVQSALLEAMQERRVTISEDTFDLPKPFLVLSTQNPIEQEGTFPLPEAQVDRFLLKTVIDYPTVKQEQEILNRMETSNLPEVKAVIDLKEVGVMQGLVEEVFVDDSIKAYITDIVFASREPANYKLEELKNLIAYGASPRGSLGLMQSAKAHAFLEGRSYVVPEDVKAISLDVLRHRVIPHYEAQAEGITSDDLVQKIIDNVPVP